MKTGDGTRIFLLFLVLMFSTYLFFRSFLISLIISITGCILGVKYRKYQYRRDMKVDIDNIDSIIANREEKKVLHNDDIELLLKVNKNLSDNINKAIVVLSKSGQLSPELLEEVKKILLSKEK